MPLFRVIAFILALIFALKNFAFLQTETFYDQVLLAGFLLTVWGIIDDISVCAYVASDWEESTNATD